MKIALFGKSPDEAAMPYIQQLITVLEEAGVNIMLYEPFKQIIDPIVKFSSDVQVFNTHEELKQDAQYLLSVGGDGTFLDTVTLIRDSGIPVLGVNLGRLGFLSSVSKDEIRVAVMSLVNGDFELEQRTLLRLKTKDHLFGDLNYALNELAISRKDSNALLVIHVYVDGKILNSYWADGLIVATPTGSTAYSLSCGGPIVAPGSENFVITPIANHNLTVRPIVIPDESKIQIKLEGRDKQFLISLDSRREIIEEKVVLNIEKESFKINLVHLKNKDFFATIREKLKWGLDIRN
ncbi:MAG: NAD kinase [Bacteroidetes bacterium]|nr:NAD kinase [Bacteroidota bacterium]|tara:strand:- start:831 stop:1709 length:879 start_codon:yes stop_codon:yes gene_type:complete